MPSLSLGLFNARSVRNKTSSIADNILDQSLDILVLTETWLRQDDDLVCGELTPPGYVLHHRPRVHGNEGYGGVGILIKENIKVEKLNADKNLLSVEVLQCRMKMNNDILHAVIVYRPPPSSSNRLTWKLFLEEFSNLLSNLTCLSGKLILLGDINIHLNDMNDPRTREFCDMLAVNNLTQLIQRETHTHGNTLDVVCVRQSEDLVDLSSLDVFPPGIWSDHSWITLRLFLKPPLLPRKKIEYRPWKRLDEAAFTEGLQNILTSVCSGPHSRATEMLADFVMRFKELIDNLIPTRTKLVSSRPAPPWYSHEVHLARAKRRKLERIWRTNRTEDHLNAYKEQCRTVKRLLSTVKKNYYNNGIESCEGDQKKLFNIVNTLLQRKSAMPLPTHMDPTALAEDFSDFFMSKISKIRDSIRNDSSASSPPPLLPPPVPPATLNTFELATVDEVQDILLKSPSKHCDLDSLPTWLLKEHAPDMAPLLTLVINDSLSSGKVPDKFKEAIVIPTLKKPSLNKEDLGHYRPVSNLNFCGKLLEKVVASRLNRFLSVNHLLESHQSAYRVFHSTETALTKVYNDIALALDERKVAGLVLLDLSAAFDTIDCEMLLDRCEHEFGLRDTVLRWLKSYMTNRKQSVSISGHLSHSRTLSCGVPQGSILGPLLFIMYTSPLGRLLRQDNVLFHLYADDTQLYMLCEEETLSHNIQHMEGVITKVMDWMAASMLKLNSNKTEFLLISTKQQLQNLRDVHLRVGNDVIHRTDHARNIGVTFDSTLSMIPHINSLSSSLNYHLRNISRIRPFLTRDSTEKIIHALISSRLDYGNALLVNLPAYCLRPLQLAQNTAARIIMRMGRYKHVSMTLQALHWLPVQARIHYKVACLTFKAIHGLSPPYVYVADLITQLVPEAVEFHLHGWLALPMCG